MEEIIENYQHLCISAFKKVEQVSSTIHSITLGPNSTFNEESQYNSAKKGISKKPVKSKVLSYCKEPGFDLRQMLALKEMQRVEQVQNAIILHQKQFAEEQQRHKDIRKERCCAKQKELLRKVQQEELAILQALEEDDKIAMVQSEKRQHYYQQLEEKRRMRDLELQAKERTKKYLGLYTKNQQEIRMIYQDIINILKSNVIEEVIKKPIADVTQKLKNVTTQMDELTTKCKVSISEVEIKQSDEMLQQMLILKKEVELIIDELNKQKEITKQKQAEEIRIKSESKEEIKQNVFEKKSQAVYSANNVTIENFVSKASFHLYSNLQEFLQNQQNSYKDLLVNDAIKQFKFDCKKAVNIPVNAISAVNPPHLLDKYNKLYKLLSGQSVPVGDSQMSAKQHPQGLAFCMDLLAKKFVLQGDLMISSNPEAAFCYATVILSLWNEFPEFGKLLLGHFHKQCPYLVPMCLPKVIGQSDEEFYKSLGYQYNDGIVEKQDKFLKRMTGIMRLYSAIIISKPKKSQQQSESPHGISQGWRWLTATLNLKPETDVTATLLHVFLETAGSTMQNTYKKEFRKIIGFIVKVYMPTLKKIDTGGPYTRLEVLLQEYQQRGQFPEPDGLLPSGYW